MDVHSSAALRSVNGGNVTSGRWLAVLVKHHPCDLRPERCGADLYAYPASIHPSVGCLESKRAARAPVTDLLDSQRGFVVSVDSGRIIDIYTGRCLTVWECTDTENAVITADTCGGGCASSKPEGQTWEIHSSGSLLIKSSVSEGVRCIDASKSHSEGEPPVVAHTCGLVGPFVLVKRMQHSHCGPLLVAGYLATSHRERTKIGH